MRHLDANIIHRGDLKGGSFPFWGFEGGLPPCEISCLKTPQNATWRTPEGLILPNAENISRRRHRDVGRATNFSRILFQGQKENFALGLPNANQDNGQSKVYRMRHTVAKKGAKFRVRGRVFAEILAV